MAESQSIIVFHGRHFVGHLGICNPICIKLLQIMSGVIPRNLKQKRPPVYGSGDVDMRPTMMASAYLTEAAFMNKIIL